MEEKIQKAVLKAVFKRLDKEECVVFLFGSYVTGEETDFSDIDIGLLSTAKIPAKDFLAIQEELKDTSGTLRKIDLVDFGNISEKVKKEALKEIQIWHAGKNCRALLKTLRPPVKS